MPRRRKEASTRVVVTRSIDPTSDPQRRQLHGQPPCARSMTGAALRAMGSSSVGFTETMIDESSFLRRIAVVGTHVKRHHWSSGMRSNEKELSHRSGSEAAQRLKHTLIKIDIDAQRQRAVGWSDWL